VVGHRVGEDLPGDERGVLVAQAARGDSGQVPARAVAQEHDPLGITTDRSGVLADPPQGREAVLHWYRERVLGSEPVVDRHHDASGLVPTGSGW